MAETSAGEGEYPFAAVIASNGAFLCESVNRVERDHDVNSHAEIVAIAKAQAIRGANLSDCTIYATVEPCAQCSYAIREARIGKVVYGLRSPLMGGHSRWNILSDTNLSTVLPEVFLPAPEIVPGFLQDEVEAVFRRLEPAVLAGDQGQGRIRRRRRRKQLERPYRFSSLRNSASGLVFSTSFAVSQARRA